MSSGIKVNPEVKEAYQELKSGHKYETLVFKINDAKTEIVVERKVESQSYEEFYEMVKTEYKDIPRYFIHDFRYTIPDGGKRSKVTFIHWVPDTAQIKQKMVAASSKDSVKKDLEGIAIEVQGTDLDEIHYDEVMSKAQKGK